MKVIVIGGGLGGYTCAIRAAQKGADVTLIERDMLGGTCLNCGCIPTKAVLHSAKMYSEAKSFHELGIEINEPYIDLVKVIERKDRIVKKLRGGVEYLMKKNSIRVIKGSARFSGEKTIEVSTANGVEVLSADNIVIAAGSRPFELPFAPTDGELILNSNDLLTMTEQPDSMIIIGGGVIGCEFAQAFAMMDTEVTIVEMLPSILANLDTDLSALMEKQLVSQGVRIETGGKLTGIVKGDDSVRITVEKDGGTFELTAERLLIAIGRTPNTDGLCLEHCGILTDRKGCIPVDGQMRTNADGIYAVGDITGSIQLAHVAAHQGMIAAENMYGAEREMAYNIVPSCIYTTPELATMGKTAENAGMPVNVGVFPMSANGRSLIENCTSGFAKVVSSEEDGTILGVHLAGANVTEMISGMAGMIGFEANADDVSDWIFAHPSVSEAIYESVLDLNKASIHK